MPPGAVTVVQDPSGGIQLIEGGLQSFARRYCGGILDDGDGTGRHANRKK